MVVFVLLYNGGGGIRDVGGAITTLPRLCKPEGFKGFATEKMYMCILLSSIYIRHGNCSGLQRYGSWPPRLKENKKSIQNSERGKQLHCLRDAFPDGMLAFLF